MLFNITVIYAKSSTEMVIILSLYYTLNIWSNIVLNIVSYIRFENIVLTKFWKAIMRVVKYSNSVNFG